MGIDYSAAIFVGLPYEDIQSDIMEYADKNEIDFYEAYDEIGISRLSPYFDADDESCLFGYFVVNSRDYSYKKIDLNDLDVNSKIDKFESIFGKTPNVYLSPYGT